MVESVKRTSSRDEAGMVEASSHQPPKKCRKAKVVEASSDQPQKGGRMVEVVKPFSDQTQKGGRKAKLPPEEKRRRKRACDNRRYHKKEDTLRDIGEMKPQLEILKNKNAELDTQLGKVNSELLPAITQDMKTMKDDLELVKNDFKKMGSHIEKFLQKELTEGDLMSIEIPWDKDYLEGEENRSMVLGPSKHISNGVGGMSKQEILAEFEKTRGSYEELKRENERRYKELKKENERRYEELKRENEELKRENKSLNSRIAAVETLKNK